MKQFKSLLDLLRVFSDEQKCIDHLAAVRWANGIVCPHCGSSRRIHRFSDNRTYKCADCRRQFTVRIGTIFEDSKLPLQKWYMAFYLVTSHKKGISSCQLAKDIDVTQKTAWFVLQRIRYLVGAEDNAQEGILDGIIEIDETYVGGKEKNKHAKDRVKGTRGRSLKTKAVILGMQARNGNLTMKHLPSCHSQLIKREVNRKVSAWGIVMTDEAGIYNQASLGRRWHAHVNHSKGEYVNDFIHTNSIEGAFSHFKRSIIGIYHHLSKKHLQKYASMFSFRWNTRKMRESQRMNRLLGCVNQKRLTYKELIA